MSAWALLAPGPSASAEPIERARDSGMRVGVVCNAYELAPWAEFIAATDLDWWLQNPDALACPGKKYTMHAAAGIERVEVPAIGDVCNSGVLALEVARMRGATRIELYGFDMHGSHFFGEYTNGLGNTSAKTRTVHLEQYRKWAAANTGIEVINCTPASAIDCFPMMGLK